MIAHGTILGGVVTTPDVEQALADYRDTLGMELVADGSLGSVAESWGAPALADARCATLRPKSGEPCWIRLVEQPLDPSFKPVRTIGWAAYELSVQDVFGWAERLGYSGFAIVGPPKEIAGLPYFVAMQVTGRGGEMLYLNEVRCNTPTSDLFPARSATDRIFIVILAAHDLKGTVDWYRDRLALEEGGRYEIVYSMINQSFGLPGDTLHQLAMVQKGRMPIIEVDAYPAEASARSVFPGHLPPGNALVSLAVEQLEPLALDWISTPRARPQPPYEGAVAATVRGPAGELLELIQRR